MRISRACVVVAGIVLAMPIAAEDGVRPLDTNYDRIPATTIVPRYPEKARAERVEGEVQVCFDISRKGLPQRITVRRSTHRYFEKVARDAVRRSTWRPVPRSEPVPGIKGCRTFRFTLEPVPPDERD